MIFFASVHEYSARETDQIDEDTLRGLILSRISYINNKFTNKFGKNIVLAFDSRDDYWKKKIFSYYKAGRKKARDKSKIDFDLVFPMWNKIAEEFMENLPYVSMRLSGVEADEIFATLVYRCADEEEKILIVSADEDSVQLQKMYKNVYQYSLKRKSMLTIENTKYDLFEHILRGDKGDGIPNILSPEDTFMHDGTRQATLYKKSIEEWRLKGGIRNPEKFCDEEMLKRFKMNKKLIDFEEIPMDVIEKIEEQYRTFKKPKGKLFNYFIQHGLTRLMETFK